MMRTASSGCSAIPHFLILYGLQIVARAVAVISWFAIVFTGKMPEGLATLQCLYIRYSNRAVTYAGFLREEYPPFAFDTIAPDPGNYPPVAPSSRPSSTWVGSPTRTRR